MFHVFLCPKAKKSRKYFLLMGDPLRGKHL